MTPPKTDELSSSSAGGTSGTKRRKMADLKAFVETRLLSRSDKTLEKIDFVGKAARSLLSAPETVSPPVYSISRTTFRPGALLFRVYT